MTAIRIDDPADPRIADYRNVPDAELLERRGIFVAEGRLVVQRLLEGPHLRARSMMVTEPAYAALRDEIDRHAELPVYLVPQPLMDTVTGFNIHRGCLAIGERPARVDWRTLADGARRLVVLERVGNADNVGAVFRNSAAFGVDAVLLGPSCADPLYRKAIRTSMAATLSIPFASAEPWPDALHTLRAMGIAVIGLTPSTDTRTVKVRAARLLREVVTSVGDRGVALVVGHEGDGLSQEALDACEFLARIPMANGVDSVNVATAIGIALYELSQNPLAPGRGSAR